jgi:hypothetical protein
LENLQKNTANRYEAQYERELIPESLIQRLDKIDATPVQDMTAEQIEALNDTLRMLVHNNNTKNKLILNGILRDVVAFMNGAAAELDNVRDIPIDESGRPITEQDVGQYGVLHSIITTLVGQKNHDPETIVDTMSGGQRGWAYKIFVEGIDDGRQKTYAFHGRINDLFKQAATKHNISLADLQKLSPAFLRILKTKRGMDMRRQIGQMFGKELTPELHAVKIAGKNYQFTMAELMSVYMHGQSDFNLKAIIQQGLATWKKPLGKVTPSELLAISKIVESDKKAMAFIEMAESAYDSIFKAEINNTSKNLLGIALAKVNRYWHVERYGTGGLAGAHRYRINDVEQTGQLQLREGSDKEVIVRDFFEVYFNDAQAIAEYVGMAEPLRNARNLINYKTYRNKLRDKGYLEHLRTLDQLLHNVQALPIAGDAIDAVAAVFMRGTVRAVLAEPGIFLGQYTSFNGIFNEMSRKYMSAARIKATAKDKQRYMDNMPSVKARFEGGVSSLALSYLAENDAVLRAFSDKIDFLSYFTSFIHKVDSLAIADICRATEAEMQDTALEGKSQRYWRDVGINPAELEVGSEQYWEHFRRRASFLIRRTQPMFTPESRSLFTGERHAAKRMWSLFRSYIDQPLRMARRSLTAYQHGLISPSELAADLGNVWATLALYAAVRFIVAAALYRKDEDWGDLLINMGLAPIRTAWLIGFPLEQIVKSSLKEARHKPPEIRTVPLGFANQVIKSLSWLSKGVHHSMTGEEYKSGPNKGKKKGPIEMERGFKLLVENALMFYGVPEDVPRRAYKGWTKRKDKDQRVRYTR